MVGIKIDEKECSGCGICYSDECPELFAEGDNGICNIQPAFQKGGKMIGEIPADKEAVARSAAMACPNNAIIVG
jgi:ferredoxin